MMKVIKAEFLFLCVCRIVRSLLSYAEREREREKVSLCSNGLFLSVSACHAYTLISKSNSEVYDKPFIFMYK